MTGKGSIENDLLVNGRSALRIDMVTVLDEKRESFKSPESRKTTER